MLFIVKMDYEEILKIIAITNNINKTVKKPIKKLMNPLGLDVFWSESSLNSILSNCSLISVKSGFSIFEKQPLSFLIITNN